MADGKLTSDQSVIRYIRLKMITQDPGVLRHLGQVAMDQQELNTLLEKSVSPIYLCGETFSIPWEKQFIKFISVKGSKLEIGQNNNQVLKQYEYRLSPLNKSFQFNQTALSEIRVIYNYLMNHLAGFVFTEFRIADELFDVILQADLPMLEEEAGTMAGTTIVREEMKADKFRVFVEDTCEKLGAIDLTADSVNPLTYIWGAKPNNPYTHIIVNKSFKEKLRPADFANAYKNLTGFIKMQKEEMEFSRRVRVQATSGNARFHFIFWALIALMVEGETNKEDNAAVIADAAYMLEFTTDMLEDWVIAAKASLMGASFKQIQFKTHEAKDFFRKMV